MINEKKLIEKIWNIFSETYNNAFNFDEDESKLVERVMIDVQNAIEEQPKIGGWIPCSERLPDKWKDVMICYYNDREEKHLLDIACLDDNGCWQLWRESGGYFPYNFRKKITHWRPLPNLPEEYHG